MDKASMTLGYLVGRQIAGMRKNQEKQPTAYLYNGVQLPPLPEWDKEMYPYAVLTRWSRERWRVYYSPEKAIYKDGVSNPLILTPDNSGPVIEHILNDGVWSGGTVREDWAMTNIITEYWWANHDILNSDGSVYLSASDPIPVYE